MKKALSIILFFLTILFFAQTNSKTFDFKFYENGKFKSPKNLKIQLVKNLDTINSELINDKILIPDVSGVYSIIGKIKNKKIVIDNVDFSKLNPFGKFIFGIENNINNLEPLSIEFPNLYILKNTTFSLKIDNLEQGKKVYFILFTFEEFTENNKKQVKFYSRYFLVKK